MRIWNRVGLTVVFSALMLAPAAALAKANACEKTAKKMFSSCKAEASEEYNAALANCLNVELSEASACEAEAKEARSENRALCSDQRSARKEACTLLGEERYDVDPLTDESLTFIDPNTIGDTNDPNPFFSLEPGHTHVLRAGEDFEETVVVTVTSESREILGQPCRVVVDAVVLVEEEEGEHSYEPVEVTDDWYAQTTNGDLYYCGELARNFEDGILRDLDGSFEAGLDSAKAGLLIRAAPMVGDAHRQEFFLGEAEDIIEYVDLAADVPAEESGENPMFPCGGGCLKTSESIPPEPEVGEFKYYIAGTGFVLGVGLEDGEVTGERDELMCVGDSLDVLEDPDCGIDDLDALLEALCTLSPDAFCGED